VQLRWCLRWESRKTLTRNAQRGRVESASKAVRAAAGRKRVRPSRGCVVERAPRTITWGGAWTGSGRGSPRRRGGCVPVRGVPASGSVGTVDGGGVRSSSNEPGSTAGLETKKKGVGQAEGGPTAGACLRVQIGCDSRGWNRQESRQRCARSPRKPGTVVSGAKGPQACCHGGERHNPQPPSPPPPPGLRQRATAQASTTLGGRAALMRLAMVWGVVSSTRRSRPHWGGRRSGTADATRRHRIAPTPRWPAGRVASKSRGPVGFGPDRPLADQRRELESARRAVRGSARLAQMDRRAAQAVHQNHRRAMSGCMRAARNKVVAPEAQRPDPVTNRC